MIQVLEEQINPAIAAHGGHAELVAVEDSSPTCGSAAGARAAAWPAVTLSQGIEVAILDAVPEITEVVDVTDHAAGPTRTTRPPRSSAKKQRAKKNQPADSGSREAQRVLGGVVRDGGVGHRVALDRVDDLGEAAPPGSRTSSPSAGMPVRTRLSAQPTLAAISPSSLATATMWHCGLPSMRRPGTRRTAP